MFHVKKSFLSAAIVLMISIALAGCIAPPPTDAEPLPVMTATVPDTTVSLPDMIEELGPLEGTTALIQAIKHGRTDIVNALLEDGEFDVDARDDDRKTALIWAAVLGDDRTDEIRLLLASGADVNAYDNDGLTALMLTALRGEIEATRVLLEDEALDINAQDNEGLTALMHAISEAPLRGYEALALLLADEELDIDVTDDDGATALVQAALNEDIESVRLLLENGADANVEIGEEQISAEIQDLLAQYRQN